jgi:superfamily II DNA or RNA helicase
MSRKFNICDLHKSDRQHIHKTLSIIVNREVYSIFDFDNDHVYLPFYFGNEFSKFIDNPRRLKMIDRAINETSDFTGTLRPAQLQVRNNAFKILQEQGCVIISSYPGFGKTITAIEMMCSLNEKTLIVTKQQIIKMQWIKAFAQYAPNRKVSTIVKDSFGGFKIDTDADVYMLSPVIFKDRDHFVPIIKEKLNEIKVVIVDEFHQIVSHVMSKSLFRLHPDILIGLSATPRRPTNDPFKENIGWFFGHKVVGAPLKKHHDVLVLKSSFTIEEKDIKYNHRGKIDWNNVLNLQAECDHRNQLIVENILKRPNKTWLILVKRVSHALRLAEMFSNNGVECETLTGTKLEFDRQCKILIGTTCKIGVGFDHAPIDALCVAADVVEYFEQFIGRCMRRPDVVPFIIDIKDAYSILNSHFLKRVKVYVKHGGKIIDAQ